MKVKELFEISYGNGLSLESLKKQIGGVNFISRTSKNNGVSSNVRPLIKIKPFESGLITVAVGGSVMESFVQTKPFYTGYHVLVLKPKVKLSLNELIYYCMCLKRNKYKYSYGRQANKTLKDIELPNKIPIWVKKFNVSKFTNIENPLLKGQLSLTKRIWRWFFYSEVFDIERGHYNKRPEKEGEVNFISASIFNNGVTDRLDLNHIEKMYDGNCITVVNNGHAGEAFYQKEKFTCSHDINIIHPKGKEINVYLAMFLITIIRKEMHRFNYGRKWRFERMRKTKIKLPIDKKGQPDWEFMENYIKSLSYSRTLEN